MREIEPKILEPFSAPDRAYGRSYGVSHAGYDVRLDQDVVLWPKGFVLASTLEKFTMPRWVLGVVHDKSTNIRMGIAVHNTVIEPGWRGHLTLEISNQSWRIHRLRRGTPIAQIIFHEVTGPVDGYNGKYQDQERGAQRARMEK